jgi:formylglycine-generating enzyme required for sulfatase activity
LQKTATPSVIPDRVDLKSDEATVFITNLYSGPGLKGVPRGTVRNLRVIEYYFSRRGFGGLYGTLGMDGPWDVKRILGTVPVEDDGSAYFSIPANTPLSIQPLDDKGQALQLMRSWMVGMPGEALSCAGCHEPQNEVSLNKPILAARRAPSAIQPWYGPARGFSFVREVQPVLDRYCLGCHDTPKPDQPGLKGGDMLTDWSTQLAGQWAGGGKFTKSYFELQRFVRRPGIEGDRRMFTPMDYHFSATELGQMLRKGHHGVMLDAESWQRLTTWTDLNAPFYGTWGEIPQFCTDPAGAAQLANVSRRATELRRQYVPMGPHPDYEAVPTTAPYDTTPVKPAPESPPVVSEATTSGWPFSAADAIRQQQETAPAGTQGQLTLPLREGKPAKLTAIHLVWIPSGNFVMGSADGHPDERPPQPVLIEKGFWMGRTEITNAQFREYMASHESRTEDRHGYQFGALGYDQDQPGQPAVRVSWDEAAGYCQWLSQKTGRKFTLPTEVQWEWACRAGAATPFWWGGMDTDYSPFANLGDRKLKEFAADTALDNYTAARPMVNPNRFDDWIPHDERFDDGGLVTVTVGQYRPNPWGLNDMHGNAWEWTRSVYRPYPYRSDDGSGNPSGTGTGRVVRGGSWHDRPKRCTASFRLAYPQFQKVFNVGFRVVCEE